MKKYPVILDVVRNGTEYLAAKGIESPRLNIELLLCDVLNIERISIYTQHDKPLNDDELAKLREYTRRRALREPLQYILQKQSFVDLDIRLNSNVLIPRPETELLADKAVSILKSMQGSPSVLDIGTGSGCIAIYIAKHCSNCTVTAIDVSQEAINTAEENARINSVDNISFFVSDILKVTPKKKYDLIVSNPPYISEKDYSELEAELMFEPKNALSDFGDGLAFYRRYADFFGNILNDNGSFLLEIGAGQSDEVKALFLAKKFDVILLSDYAGIPRIVVGRKKNN